MRHKIRLIGCSTLLFLSFIFLLVLSCTERPENIWDNPLDPMNSEMTTDPYHLTAQIASGGIQLSWSAVTSLPIAGYAVHRQVDANGFTRLAIVDYSITTYTDTLIENGRRYEYFVVAIDNQQREADHSQVVHFALELNPVISIAGDIESTNTRHVELTLIAFGAVQMRISNLSNFQSAVWEPFSSIKDWMLRTGPETYRKVYLQVAYDEAGTRRSAIVSDSIDVRFPSNCTFQIIEPDTVTRNYITLSFTAIDAESIRIAQNTPITQGIWVAYSDIIYWDLKGVPRGAGILESSSDDNDSDEIKAFTPERKNIEIGRKGRPAEVPAMQNRRDELDIADYELLVQFKNDFEVLSEILSDHITVEIRSSVLIQLGQEFTNTRRVLLTLWSEDATLMAIDTIQARLITNPSWVPYQGNIHNFMLASGPGMKYAYAKFKNDTGAESSIFSDSIGILPLNPALEILPSDRDWINTIFVQLSMPEVGAREMLISNNSNPLGSTWQSYRELYTHQLETGDGIKHVYVWFRNDFLESGPEEDVIGLDTRTQIDNFSWTTSGGEIVHVGDQLTFTVVMAPDNVGAEVDGSATVTVEGMLEEYQLQDNQNGTYSSTLTVTAELQAVIDAPVTAYFTDRGGNLAAPVTSDDHITFWVESGAQRWFPLGDTPLNISMTWIAPGSYEMGARPGEQGGRTEELPLHTVTIARGFWIGTFEVTQEQWQAVTGSNPSFHANCPQAPVEQVSWEMVQDDFIEVLNASEPGSPWRLPSESEWEYAARAGTVSRFYWGEDLANILIEAYAWYEGNATSTMDVGGKSPNPWGLYDVLGNVSEWCEDWYHSDYNGAPADGSAWLVPVGTRKVARGGNWAGAPRTCRSAARSNFYPTSTGHNFLGFRLVREVQ